MSGQLIGAVGGAVIGFAVGGPFGASVGWAAGSIVGSILDPTRVDGPRLADRKIQVSTYGAAIPIIYGGTAGTGNVIWSTDLVEHEVESEGKGTVTTSHTYSVSCAILISEGEIANLRRIWADSKLVYDVSDGADPAAQAASAAFAEFFVFYHGTETQLPDPTIEAALGAGNVSAYRGSCYIVFTDLPLEDYGNRIPNFKFEVSTEIATSTSDEALSPYLINEWLGADMPAHTDGVTEYKVQLLDGSYDFSNPVHFYTTYDIADAISALQAAWPTHTNYISYFTSTNAALEIYDFGSGINEGFGARYAYFGFSTVALSSIHSIHSIGLDGYTCGSFVEAELAPHAEYIRLISGLYVSPEFFEYIGHTGPAMLLPYGVDPPTGFEIVTACFEWGDESGELSLGWYPVICHSPMRFIRAERMLSLPSQTCQVGDPCLLGKAQVPGNSAFCITCDGSLSPNLTYEAETGSYQQLTIVAHPSVEYTSLPQGPIVRSTDPLYGDVDYWDEQAALAGITGSYGSEYGRLSSQAGVAEIPANQVDEGTVDLAVIVADICRRAGMPGGSPGYTYNVAALSGIPVQGYSIARQMPARQALLQLQQTFWWDFVESGRQIKAVLRGGTSAVTIGADDLGATEGEPVVSVVPNRAQETELPATVNVAYPVREAGYETGTQRARRVVTGSQQVISLELSVVMTDLRAAQVADVMMVSSWTNRTERKWQTTRKFAKYEPTDVVTLYDDEFTYVVRITERSEEGGVIKWSGVDEAPAAYSPNVTPGVGSGNVVGGITIDGPMKLELIDSPIVADDDDDAGFYGAAAGYMPSWHGGNAFKSLDAGATYTAALNMPLKGTLGYATTVLGDWTGGNMVDEGNSVTVRMHNGTLSTITLAQLLNDGNIAILGDEIFQFQRSELVSTGVYKLTGLLRGRRGTEQHMAGHAVNERFMLFSATTTYRIPGTLSEINVDELWKGVTYGQTTDAALEIEFTNTGAGLKPLAPAHLHAVDIGGGEFHVSWVRRTRIGGKWRDGVEVPLGETSESYTVVVLDSSTVLSTQSTSSSELDVTAVAGNTITVYQNSSAVGRGFPSSVQL